MNKSRNGGGREQINDGYVPRKRGYKPATGGASNGHKPATSETKPVSPPKKR